MNDLWDSLSSEDNISSQERIVNHQVEKAVEFLRSYEIDLRNVILENRDGISESRDFLHSNAFQTTLTAVEKVSINDLIITDCDILRKVMIVFVYLCDEVEILKNVAETKFYSQILLFGNAHNDDKTIHSTINDYRDEVLIGRIIPLLQDLHEFVLRCNTVVKSFIHQFAALYSSKFNPIYHILSQNFYITKIFNTFGHLLSILLIIDTLIQNNDFLLESWIKYKSFIKSARSNISLFNSDESSIQQFESLLVTLDLHLMCNNIFQNCIDQDYEILDDSISNLSNQCNNNDNDDDDFQINIRYNEQFLNEMSVCIKSLLEGTTISHIENMSELTLTYDVIGIHALYVLHRALLPKQKVPDSVLYKQLWSAQKTIPVVFICQKVPWFPSDIFLRYAFLDVKRLDPLNPATFRKEYLDNFDLLYSQKLPPLLTISALWPIATESTIQ
eukprot:gene9638-20031_t